MRLHRNLVYTTIDALNAIFNEGEYADKVVARSLKKDKRWGSSDRKFVAETIYEIVRWKRLYAEIAEVKEPFSCPNNSLSINSVGMAAQFTSIIGLAALLLFSCIHLATNSLPTPFSPVINTRASVGATFSMVSLIFLIGALSPIISCTCPPCA